MNKIEAAIFDVGQVLHAYDPKPIHQDIKETLIISDEEFKKNWNRLTVKLELGTISEEEYWSQFKIATNSTAELPFESLLIRKYGVGFRIFDDVIDIAKSLKEKGIKIAILSNSIEPHYLFNRKAGIYDEFQVQIFSHQVGFRKPNIEIYQLTLDRLQISANQGLFIDDRDENVEAAKNLGIYGHVFVNAITLRKDLEERFGILT